MLVLPLRCASAEFLHLCVSELVQVELWVEHSRGEVISHLSRRDHLLLRVVQAIVVFFRHGRVLASSHAARDVLAPPDKVGSVVSELL